MSTVDKKEQLLYWQEQKEFNELIGEDTTMIDERIESIIASLAEEG